jgi:hypothetical protein
MPALRRLLSPCQQVRLTLDADLPAAEQRNTDKASLTNFEFMSNAAATKQSQGSNKELRLLWRSVMTAPTHTQDLVDF